MSVTKYFAISEISSGWSILFADDDLTVISGFKREFGESSITEITMDEFAACLKDVSIQKRKLVFLDGTLTKETKTSTLDGWLTKRGFSSNENCFLVGYSGDEANKTSRCIRWYVKSAHIQADIAEIKRLCQDTASGRRSISEWPVRLAQPLDELSRTIHALQNLFLPVKLDAQTLKKASTEANQTLIAETFRDHFAPISSAYLSSQSHQHEGSDILFRIDSLCESLRPDIRATIEPERAAVTKAVNLARRRFGRYFDGAHDSVALPVENDLRDRLQKIAVAGDALVQALGEIRRKKQREVK